MGTILITKEKLIELYVDKGLSSIKIAKIYNCSDAGILKKLVAYNIPKRRAGNYKGELAPEHKQKLIAHLRTLHKIQVGEQHPQWKNARWFDKDGYALIRRDKKTVKEHRWVMEQHIGYKLQPWEEINHKNLVKSDNSLDNLEVIYSEHKHKDWLARRGLPWPNNG